MYPRQLYNALFLIQCCELCFAIRVPVWSEKGDSDVKSEKIVNEFSVENFKPEDLLVDVSTTTAVPIPAEYFEYTAKKPAFAVEVAAFHGVKSPEKHYHAYPIEPDTGLQKPILGQHHMLEKDKTVYAPFQRFVQHHDGLKSHVLPVSNNYEVYHPYEAEKPALEEIYKDPVLDKIRNDLIHTKDRLQKYEKDAGKANIPKDEYLESPEDTDRKKFPHNHTPTRFEVHRPLRKPAYYRRPPKFMQRDRYLNKKFRHPLHQDYVKIKPIHYRPLKNELYNFRQNQALKYDDEKNEYPQLPPPQHFAEPPDEGYDIYEKGKSRYVNLRNNIDGAINHAVLHNRPTTFQKLEDFDNGKYNKSENYHNPVPYDENNDDDDVTTEFVPIKSYAQVRKTETTKHLPREAALDEAANFEELKNAPRLREAVKSTKAQTVYSEEGYEDAAYDHEGEQKHASDHEGHGGYLKEHELSGGRYRIPSVKAAYSDGGGTVSGDKTLHGEKWKNDDKDSQEENEDENYTDDDHEKLLEGDEYDDDFESKDEEQDWNKREETKEVIEDESKQDETSDESKEDGNAENESGQHDVIKREVNFKVPELDLNKTFFTEQDYVKKKKENLFSKKDEIKHKYPYYFKDLDKIHRNSPLRYAEDLRLIPKKSRGGTEFYDSRSDFICSEVDDDVDPIPEKIKTNGTETDNTETDHDEARRKKREIKKPQRLKGLGDKIDCFKAKYFGENPLDSPFFKEDIIANPDPIPLPNIASFKIQRKEEVKAPLMNIFNITANVKEENDNEFAKLLESLKLGQTKLQDSLRDQKSKFLESSIFPLANKSALFQQASVYTDILDNMSDNFPKHLFNEKVGKQLLENPKNGTQDGNVSYNSFLQKESVTKLPLIVRKKRLAQFLYEPYKIIRDGQQQDSKKTTTTGNISPLIRQLQSSSLVDKVTTFDKNQPVKRNVVSRSYKDIGKRERQQNKDQTNDLADEMDFVDVNVDIRRGEPRYELKPSNHKPHYTSVGNKKAMTLDEYKSLRNETDTKLDSVPTHRVRDRLRQVTKSTTTTVRPVFDVNKFIPRRESQDIAASKTVHRVIKTTTPAVKKAVKQESKQETSDSSEDDDYEEYEDSAEYDEPEISTTTTTAKPVPRRRIKVTTTTSTTTTSTPAPRRKVRVDNDQPTKLRLITRFNKPIEKEEEVRETIKESPVTKDTSVPKYREKTRRTSKSTLVTDTKSYGEDNDDKMRKDEVDAMIKVKQDMDDYVPTYEKQKENKGKQSDETSTKEENDDDSDDEYENDDSDSDADESGEEYEEDQNEPQLKNKIIETTPLPRRSTLPRTTEAPVSTTEARSSKLQLRPVVVKKKIEIHKELPPNKSSPHVSKFKQDIREEEIIKELPRRKPNKNAEVLDIYKDAALADKINNLGEVEVFKENLDVRKGPRHGGNYRSVKVAKKTENRQHGGNLRAPSKKAEDTQSEDTKLVQLDEDDIPIRKPQVTKSRINPQRSRGNRKHTELADLNDKITKPQLHGGNLKYEPKSDKIIELDESEGDEDSSNDSVYKSRDNSNRYDRPLHGGNYKSGKLVQANEEITKKIGRKELERSKDGRVEATKLLSSFVQAAPILTTTPAYILDPSKRMYYYVDA